MVNFKQSVGYMEGRVLVFKTRLNILSLDLKFCMQLNILVLFLIFGSPV